MALDLEKKQKYVEYIDKIWSGSMSGNSPENITQEIVDEMELILSEIRICTENINTLLDMLIDRFKKIYKDRIKWEMLAKEKAVRPGKKSYVYDWLDMLTENKPYHACVVTAAVNWKSSIQLKLMGI